MQTAFSTALTALSADSTAVDVVSNNLANMNTTGFKDSVVSFQDLVNEALSGPGAGAGFGVAPPMITSIYSQGSIQSSNGQYDAAIQGNGFFVVTDQNNDQLYTRDGNFTVDKNGDLLTATGQNVQGWDATNGVVNTNGPITNLVIPGSLLNTPVASTQFSVQANLDATQPATSASDFQVPMTVYDSLGESHTLTVDFQKSGSNTWNYTVSVPGADITAGSSGSQVATGTLNFDSNGNLIDPSTPPATQAPIPISITGLSDGAADLNLNWNIYDPTSGASTITQFASTSASANPTADGTQSASITSVSMGANGQITAQYSNGQPVVIGQLAIANIVDPETLINAGNGNLQVTGKTSLPSIGVPGTGGRGNVLGGSLESSTVDIATEFTNLIVYQRSYEANAKVVTTADQLSQDTIALIPTA